MGSNARGVCNMKLTSFLRMRALGVGCLCSLTLVGGCGDGAMSPTSPGASAAASSAVTSNGLVAEGPIANGASAGALPFHGSLQATETETGAFPILSVHLTGAGTATHLGQFTESSEFQLDLRTATGAGSFTLTSANGDRLTGSITGRAVVANGVASITEIATITGGTGRFAQASGQFTVVRSLDQATGVSSGSFDGTLDLHE